MQDFEFRIYGSRHAAPSVMLALTRDEHSAKTMAERTLRETKGCSHIDVWVARRYLFTVEAPDSVAGQGVSHNSTISPSSFWSAVRKWRRRFRPSALPDCSERSLGHTGVERRFQDRAPVDRLRVAAPGLHRISARR